LRIPAAYVDERAWARQIGRRGEEFCVHGALGLRRKNDADLPLSERDRWVFRESSRTGEGHVASHRLSVETDALPE